MDVKEVIAALRHRWAILVLIPLATAAAAVTISAVSDPVYESSRTLAARVAPGDPLPLRVQYDRRSLR